MSEDSPLIPPALLQPFKTCRETLALNPKEPSALRLMAYIQGMMGNLDAAMGFIQKSLKVAPRVPESHLTLAFVYHQQKNEDEAIRALKAAIALKPDYAEAYHNLGDILFATGNPEAAIQAYQEALRIHPHYVFVLNNLGNVFKAMERFKEAQDCYVKGIALKPDMPELYNNLALVLQRTHPDPNAPSNCLKKALDLRPNYPEAMNNLGNIYRERGHIEEARMLFNRILELAPDNAEGNNNLGLIALHNDIDLDAAQVLFERALALRPAYVEAINNLGVVQRLKGRHEEGFASFQKALALRENYTAGLNNLANMYKDYGRFEESIAAYRKGIALKPDDTETHNNLAMALLAAGNYEEGWKEYEWRWKTKHLAIANRAYSQPRWKGETEEGKTLFIYAEQGFGDTLQFCRYATMAAQKGVRVVLEVQQPVLRLLQSLEGVDQLIAQGQTPPPFDYQSPLLSLPALFGTNLDTIPASKSYLKTDPVDVETWAKRLPEKDGKLRIGLVWAGSSRKHSPDLIATDQRRSIKAETLAPLMDLPNVTFVSLQKDGPLAPSSYPILTLIDQSRDFADTAALIENLDLVISVDTAVAHLAAAIGKPVWMLNRYDSCWRWQRDRETTAWYPTMRVFHQKSWGAWEEVVARVKQELSALPKV